MCRRFAYFIIIQEAACAAVIVLPGLTKDDAIAPCAAAEDNTTCVTPLSGTTPTSGAATRGLATVTSQTASVLAHISSYEPPTWLSKSSAAVRGLRRELAVCTVISNETAEILASDSLDFHLVKIPDIFDNLDQDKSCSVSIGELRQAIARVRVALGRAPLPESG